MEIPPAILIPDCQEMAWNIKWENSGNTWSQLNAFKLQFFRLLLAVMSIFSKLKEIES